ncbi:Glycosyl hydrolase family 81, carbohydrate binding module (family 6) [Halapricum desulfuricans]|uniref:Glycosyl hydrolase family 81, carbohydrate binding module (Family 6) n=1 Tax=Halapricum desulfuricans TaxID=2841257 RepID=A0A897NQ41_9EURY|nr:fibronectin type III domain-containing protein [Halapricum desulfuricans]QSG12949.1 Glycosyl hydrolase family 81, carbohydrate binding module (family 6) [Halapricum desulfuricans]
MSDSNRTSRFGLSRRTFVQGIGASGLVGAGTNVASAAIDDESVTPVGSGSVTTAIPDGYDYPSPPDPTYVTGDVSPPIPTNDWWSGLLFGPYSAGPVIGDPYHGKAGPAGFTVTYPTDWDGDPAEQDTIVADTAQTPGVTIGHTDVEEFSDARVNDWGDWHVQATWGAGTDEHMDVTIARGLPLCFAEYSEGGARLAFSVDDRSIDDAAVSVWADRGNVLGITVSANGYDKHFGMFAPEGASWSGVSTAELRSELGDGDYLTVAVLPDASTDLLDQFERYAYNVVRDTTVDWEYVPDDDGTPVSEVRTTYSFATEAKPESQTEGTVTALFPHQWKHAVTELTDRTYWSVRGEMRVATGTSFTMAHTYDGILPFTPTSGVQDTETLRSYMTRLAEEYEPYVYDVPTSAYWAGKDFYRNSTAAAIADRTGQTEKRDYFLSAVTDRLEGWLSADDTALGTEAGQELFYYDDSRQVAFSDGMTVTVPAGEVVVAQSADHYGADTDAPMAPADLTAASTNSWAVELEWKASEDDTAVQYYVVTLDGTTHTTVSDPGVRIEGLDRGTEYTVVVSAVDPYDNESVPTSVTVTTDSEDTAPPEAPSDLQTASKTKTSVDLAWSPASDVGEESGIESYLVVVDGEQYTEVDETAVSVTGLDPDTRYTFAVRAIDEAGNRSEPVSTTAATLSESATQSPFEGRATIPGKVEAENFDQGDEGVAYHETTSK